MKKITVQTKNLVVLFVMLLGSVLPAMAIDFEVDGIAYNVIGENEVEVTARDSVKYTGDVVIPATVVQDGVTYNVTRIGTYAFMGCREMSSVDIPEGVTSLCNGAFNACSMLEGIDLPNSLVSIGKLAFWGCSGLTQFYVPRNLTDIAYNAFMACYNIGYFSCSPLNPCFKAVNGILYTKDLTMLYAYPPGATATTFAIPSTVTKLYDYCFGFNHYLERVTIPETVTWMGMNIFRECTKIDSIYIPDGVTHMGVTVFGNCYNLTSVHLPASLDTIYSSAFLNCSSLTEVTVPRNVSHLDDLSFSYNPAIKKIIFEEGSRLRSIGDQAFRECNALERFDVPSGVDSIGGSCFYECQSLKTLNLNEGLRVLNTFAIGDCPSMVECTLPGSLAVVESQFLDCYQLKRVKVGDKNSTPGTTRIKSHLFFWAKNVECVELGANVDSLERYALNTPDKTVKVVISWAAVPPRSSNMFASFPTAAVLYVPKASLEAYREANDWKRFTTIVAIEDVGDVNGDSFVNISDATALINHLSADGPVNAPLADVNMDGYINISDVIALINKLLNE
jgi:hypothetical protein